MEEPNVYAGPTEPVEKIPPVSSTPQRKEESSLAIASVICGGLSLFFGLFTAVPAVICGHMALNDYKRNPDKYDSSAKSMSIAGMVLGYVFIGITVLVILAFVMIFVVAAGAA